ncbi:hypothetical protein MRX96_044158 [Rhipicephalus microplus]
MVKIETSGDDSSWHAGAAGSHGNQKRLRWPKAVAGHDAAAKLGGPLWLKVAENGNPGSQVNDKHRHHLGRHVRVLR